MPVTRTYDHEPTPAERGDYWVAVHTWIFQVEGLSHNALCTYIGLASYADRAGVAWPSVQTIADRVRLSPSSVHRGIAELKALGLLEVEASFKDGLQRPNRYRLRMTAPAPLVDAVPVEDAQGSVAWAVPAREPAPAPVVVEDASPVPVSHPDAPPCHGDRPGVSQGQTGSVTVTDPVCHGDRQNTSIEHHQRTPPELVVRAAHHDTPPARPETQQATTTATVAAPSKPSSRGTRIPDDFQVTPAMAQWAAENFPDVDAGHETCTFYDYWRSASGQRAVKRDWEAAWRNWIRQAHKFAQDRRTPASRPPLLEIPTDETVWDAVTDDLFTPTAYRDVMGGGGR